MSKPKRVVRKCHDCGYDHRSSSDYPKCRKCGSIIPTAAAFRIGVQIEISRVRYYISSGLPYRSIEEVWDDEQMRNPYWK